jgi:hypothetical protein
VAQELGRPSGRCLVRTVWRSASTLHAARGEPRRKLRAQPDCEGGPARGRRHRRENLGDHMPDATLASPDPEGRSLVEDAASLPIARPGSQ